jgi:hypothetical protein
MSVCPTPGNTVTWAYADAPDGRWGDVTEILDATLSTVLNNFTSALG